MEILEMSKSEVVSVVGLFQGSSTLTVENGSVVHQLCLHCTRCSPKEYCFTLKFNGKSSSKEKKNSNVKLPGQNQLVTLFSVPSGEVKRQGCEIHGVGSSWGLLHTWSFPSAE